MKNDKSTHKQAGVHRGHKFHTECDYMKALKL